MEMLKPKDSVRLKAVLLEEFSEGQGPGHMFLHQVSVARAARDLALGEGLGGGCSL